MFLDDADYDDYDYKDYNLDPETDFEGDTVTGNNSIFTKYTLYGIILKFNLQIVDYFFVAKNAEKTREITI